MSVRTIKRCDVFCTVIDNFGDIGICWRLSRQMAAEHNIAVTLWVDDLQSFQRICPEINPQSAQQQQFGVLIRLWQAEFPALTADEFPDLLIEALACSVPTSYLSQFSALRPDAIWLNLEYLSAEDWVHGCHSLASPQAGLNLAKYFFFPGFTTQTGGLLREKGLVENLQTFSQDVPAQQQFWAQAGVVDAMQYQLKISLFCYQQQAIADFVGQLQQLPQSVLLLVPEGVVAQQLRQIWPELATQTSITINRLRLELLPFMPQPHYDYLLAACDLNFVRGEDSVIRAHWAGKPMIWQIYRQQEQAHQVKLQAFLDKYLQAAPAAISELIRQLHIRWDLEQSLAELMPLLIENMKEITEHQRQWQQFLLLQQDLVTNLVRFAENKFIMPRNFS
ncbi:elongation factor P maturation arginine rhamnosyltransferase EarP [Rheinheimera riviphila]|uniref:Protein-arginine rhamnosyltransferase n=1 Tax=Rheinheimera riviphila TaxID=1834037 RepID=A0A437R1S5_9GAMM|nr:elongation factor P maturation arginine rhamnosyltransferase EarP [Rheinheimera riviphila]RVU40744.1 elongation factor P maturation arginine rhamnosyltransferase EarP [Rheinheimera riviphila]